MLLKFVTVFFAINGVYSDISLCELPDVTNLSCMRIGNKLRPEQYEIDKCDMMTVENRKGVFFCGAKTKLSSHSDTYACVNGQWKSLDDRDKGLPICEVTCPELLYRPEATIVKDQDGNLISNDERVVAGTKLSISCSKDYVKAAISDNLSTIECLATGEWSANYSDCIKESSNGGFIQLSYKGNVTEIAQYPWHVAIYKIGKTKTIFICGGSIISEQVIVSAAHCFWDSNRNTADSEKNFLIVAGKSYKNFDAEKDKDSAQKRDVSKIYIHNTYADREKNYDDDIAVVVVSTPFTFTQSVSVVKLSFEKKYLSGRTGQVVGWGKTEKNKLSNELRFVNLDIVTCMEPKPGKFCAVGNDQSTCQGDSGGGFVIYEKNQPLLIGVVSASVSVHNLGCTSDAASYNYFEGHEDLFAKAKDFLQDFFPCSNNMIKCDGGCLPISRVCDGVRDCANSHDESNCTIRSSYGMLSKGLEVLKYFEKCDGTLYPNWIIPTSGLWLSAKYLAEVASSPAISNQLKVDFGIIDDPSIVSNIRAASIVDAKLKSTTPLRANKWNTELFREQAMQRQAANDFFYQNTSRITLLYDSDLRLNIDGFDREYRFRNADGTTESVQGICVLSARYWESASETVFKIESKDNFNLYIVQSQGNMNATMASLRAQRLDALNTKLVASKPVCFPKFKLLSTADYSPIFYKLGYDYAFSLDPVQLEVEAKPVRIQMLIRAFLSIQERTVQSNAQQLSLTHVDKPFVFILEERSSNAVIFVGRVVKGNHYTKYANSYTRCKPFELQSF